MAVSLLSPLRSSIAARTTKYVRLWNPERNQRTGVGLSPAPEPVMPSGSLFRQVRRGCRSADEVDGRSPVVLRLDLQIDVQISDSLEFACPSKRTDVDRPEADRAQHLGDHDARPSVVGRVQGIDLCRTTSRTWVPRPAGCSSSIRGTAAEASPGQPKVTTIFPRVPRRKAWRTWLARMPSLGLPQVQVELVLRLVATRYHNWRVASVWRRMGPWNESTTPRSRFGSTPSVTDRASWKPPGRTSPSAASTSRSKMWPSTPASGSRRSTAASRRETP